MIVFSLFLNLPSTKSDNAKIPNHTAKGINRNINQSRPHITNHAKKTKELKSFNQETIEDFFIQLGTPVLPIISNKNLVDCFACMEVIAKA